MKLYTVQVAPNPTKVELYLAEKEAKGANLNIERVTVRLMKGEQNQPEHLARNPFGSIPVLETENGEYIVESLAIIEYVEERYTPAAPQTSMWGVSALERAHNRDYERIADTRVLAPIARYIHATNSPIGMAASPDIAAAAEKVIPIGLHFFDELLSDGRPFIAGSTATVGDCTLAAALQFARFGGYTLSDTYQHLSYWDQQYRQRECVNAVIIA